MASVHRLSTPATVSASAASAALLFTLVEWSIGTSSVSSDDKVVNGTPKKSSSGSPNGSPNDKLKLIFRCILSSNDSSIKQPNQPSLSMFFQSQSPQFEIEAQSLQSFRPLAYLNPGNYFSFSGHRWSRGYNNVTNACLCENNGTALNSSAASKIDAANTCDPSNLSIKMDSAKPLSGTTLLLYNTYLLPYSRLPLPRVLSPRDPLFSYPQLKRGIDQRRKDEEKLKRLLSSSKIKNQIQEAREQNDQQKINKVLNEMNSIIYGENVTPQKREDFLIQFGCTGCTNKNLEYLVTILGRSRGFIEVGAGNGQWARALTDYYNQQQQQGLQGRQTQQSNQKFEFVLAYDTMQDLPLSPKIYHGNTLPAKKYFYNNVRQCASHIDAVQGYAAKGRVLLLVYPPPGGMALETVQTYVGASNKSDGIGAVGDTVVWRGQRRGQCEW